MKFLVMLSLSLVAASAMACPDLAGTYQCQAGQNGSGVMTIANSPQGYVITNQDDPSNSGLWPTDGKTYNTDDGGTFVGSCSNSYDVVQSGNDAQVGPYTITLHVSVDASKNLVQDGSIKAQDQEMPFNETCARIN